MHYSAIFPTSCRGEGMWSSILLLFLSSVEGLLDYGPPRCPGANFPGGGEADLTVVSGQNSSGHWLAKVRLEHIAGAAVDGSALHPVQLQLHHSARQLTGGAQVIAIEATLSGYPTSANLQQGTYNQTGETFRSQVSVPSPPPSPSPSPPPSPPPPSPQKRYIPPGYNYYNGLGYYRLHVVPVTWYEAKATCEREGAYLAVINSQEEAKMVARFFPIYSLSQIWIGFHDLLGEGKFYTIFGEPLEKTGFNVWHRGEPSNKEGNENCGSLLPSVKFNDENCNTRLTLICELPK